MTLCQLYLSEKERFLDQCIQCGICAEACPVLPHTGIDTSPREIQKQVFDCVETGRFNPAAHTKAFACMQCFKCTAGICPRGLNPMLINEVVKGRFIRGGRAEDGFADSREPDSSQRIVAGVQLSGDEYRRITTPDPVHDVDYLFFPGCNVYFQPEKLLNALDIMDTLGDSYAFLPGLDNCCGNTHLFFGRHEGGGQVADELLDKISQYHPKTLVLWCPTCHCLFNTYISPSMALGFEVVSFAQYLSENMGRLPLSRGREDKVLTLHEPCKSAYTGVDLTGPRGVLSQLPGTELREMVHHGRDPMCCGSGAVCWFPDSFSRIRDGRLGEAAHTGADQMVTICHYCGQAFASKEAEFGVDVVNYVNLVAESMGIRRQDRFKTYTQWQDLDLILEDIGERIDRLPHEKKKIIDVLKSVFTG